MTRTLVLMLIALLAFGAVPALAKTTSYESTQVSISWPDDWSDSSEGGNLTVMPPDKSLALMFLPLPEGDNDKIIEEVDKAIESEVGEITWEKNEPTEDKVNGMNCAYWVGAAKKDDVVTAVITWVLYCPNDRELLCYVAAPADALDKHKAELEKIIDGIKPAAPAPAETEEEGDE